MNPGEKNMTLNNIFQQDNASILSTLNNIFQQDNASILSATDTKMWFEGNKSPTLDCSANSLDLNLMKNVWVLLCAVSAEKS